MLKVGCRWYQKNNQQTKNVMLRELYSPMLLIRRIFNGWCGPRSFKQQRLTEWKLKKDFKKLNKTRRPSPR